MTNNPNEDGKMRVFGWKSKRLGEEFRVEEELSDINATLDDQQVIKDVVSGEKNKGSLTNRDD